MRILYVLNDTFKKGGTESVVFNYFNHLDRDRYQIDFMIHSTRDEIDDNEVYKDLLGKGVVVHILTPRRISIRRNLKEMNEVFQSNHYDIVHSHADCANAIILDVAKKNGIKVRIAHSHNTESPVKITGLKSFLHKSYLEYCRLKVRKVATHYMACSEAAGLWLFGKKNMLSGKVYILNNAIDLSRFQFDDKVRESERQSLGLDGQFVVGHVGRFAPQKNHAFILDIAREFKTHDDNVKLLLVGNGPDFEKIISSAEEDGLSSIIMFYGETDCVEEILQAFDAFILPSLWEGLGIAIIEAQANGLRCVVADSEKVSKDSKLSPLVEFLKTDDPHKWRDRLMTIANNPLRMDYSDLIRRNGYDIVEESRKLEKYYKGAIK